MMVLIRLTDLSDILQTQASASCGKKAKIRVVAWKCQRTIPILLVEVMIPLNTWNSVFLR